MKPKLKDIAELANVSVGTVDRVLHNRGEVSETTRNKIIKIIKELNYQPDILARTLASKKIYNIGIILPESKRNNPYWQIPLSGIDRALNEISHFGIRVKKYLFDPQSKTSFSESAEALYNSKPEGIIAVPFFRQEAIKYSKKFIEAKIPIVFIDSNLKELESLSYIGQNSFQSGYLAAKLLTFGIDRSQNHTILIINIAKEIDSLNHIMHRANGFTA